jgi:hypothetical protein
MPCAWLSRGCPPGPLPDDRRMATCITQRLATFTMRAPVPRGASAQSVTRTSRAVAQCCYIRRSSSIGSCPACGLPSGREPWRVACGLATRRTRPFLRGRTGHHELWVRGCCCQRSVPESHHLACAPRGELKPRSLVACAVVVMALTIHVSGLRVNTSFHDFSGRLCLKVKLLGIRQNAWSGHVVTDLITIRSWRYQKWVLAVP